MNFLETTHMRKLSIPIIEKFLYCDKLLLLLKLLPNLFFIAWISSFYTLCLGCFPLTSRWFFAFSLAHKALHDLSLTFLSSPILSTIFHSCYSVDTPNCYSLKVHGFFLRNAVFIWNILPSPHHIANTLEGQVSQQWTDSILIDID